MKTTFSIIKADVGGFPGHSSVHPRLIETAHKRLAEAQASDMLIDFHVSRCGDDLELLMTHTQGEDDEEIHALAWEVFLQATEVAKSLGLYGAGQDLLKDAFSAMKEQNEPPPLACQPEVQDIRLSLWLPETRIEGALLRQIFLCYL